MPERREECVSGWPKTLSAPPDWVQSELMATDAERFDVASADGVELAVWTTGTGPALVMVHGSISDHSTFGPFVDVLREEFTTYAMDRRGFGDSTDGPDYTIEAEFADVAAVVDAVVRRTSGPVALWGHSYGANCAMGGAALTAGVNHLILYEPSLGLSYPAGSIDRMQAALDRGDPEGAIVSMLREVMGMGDDDIDALRGQPNWPARVALAHTLPRECHTEEDWVYASGMFDTISAPTVLLSGSESEPAMVAATERAAEAIPLARIHRLLGHGNLAHRSDPQLVCGIIRDVVAD